LGLPSKRGDDRAVAGAISPPRVEFIERSHQRSAALGLSRGD
jgi:hypothetical protein